MAQLVDWSLLALEIRGLNPDIGKFYLLSSVLNLSWKDEHKEKRGREWPIFSNNYALLSIRFLHKSNNKNAQEKVEYFIRFLFSQPQFNCF